MLKRTLALGAGLGIVALAAPARASNGLDAGPENGIEQMGRGSAWVARADSPLAAYYNPAALAYQSSGVYLGGHLMFRKQCMTRLNQDGTPTAPSPSPATPAPGSDGLAAAVCEKGGVFPNPQLGGVFRINDKLAIGISVLGPHAYGKVDWPETLTWKSQSFGMQLVEPAPNRYLLTASDSKLFFTTISVAYRPIETLSVGAGFIWGVAIIDFTNFSEAVSPAGATTDDFVAHSDLRGELKAKDLFIPGFTLGALWSPIDKLDVGFNFKWMDAIRSDAADVYVQSRYFDPKTGDVNKQPCDPTMGEKSDCNITDQKGIGKFSFNIPMEARLGVRYHHPRANPVPGPAWADPDKNGGRKVKDSLSQDLFDAELDFTWANNSSVDKLALAFPAGIQVNGTVQGANLPTNGDIPHNWKDVFGVRLGGDFNVIPNMLALRAGGWLETKGQDNEHLALDFDVAEKFGVAGGVTFRLGPIDTHAGFQHTFYGTIDNKGKGVIQGLSGEVDAGNRTRQAVNGGKLTNYMNEFGLAGLLHF